MMAEKCPHCGEDLETREGEYPMRWACGTTLREWEQGYYAIDPVPQRSSACQIISRLRSEIEERDAAHKKDSELAVSLYQECAELRQKLVDAEEFSENMRKNRDEVRR